MLYRSDLKVHRHIPIVPEEYKYLENERQWLLLGTGGRKCAFLHCYMACQSFTDNSYLKWNQDLFSLMSDEIKILRMQGFFVLALGDFNSRVGRIPGLENNTPDLNNNSQMFFNFIQEANLFIINSLPISKGLFTRFMAPCDSSHGRSLLDYGLINEDSLNTVTSFVIDEDARFDAGSDHALLECTISCKKDRHATWSFKEGLHYNFNERTDFSKFRSSLDNAISTTDIDSFTCLSAAQMLPLISESINNSAQKCFNLRFGSRKKGRKLPREVVASIREKGDLARQISSGVFDEEPSIFQQKVQELRRMKIDVDTKLANIKLRKRTKLRTKLLLADPSRKKFWRFLKAQMKGAGNISAVTSSETGDLEFEQHEIEREVLKHFSSMFNASSVPVPNTSTPEEDDQVSKAIDEIEKMLGRETASHPPDRDV